MKDNLIYSYFRKINKFLIHIKLKFIFNLFLGTQHNLIKLQFISLIKLYAINNLHPSLVSL